MAGGDLRDSEDSDAIIVEKLHQDIYEESDSSSSLITKEHRMKKLCDFILQRLVSLIVK